MDRPESASEPAAAEPTPLLAFFARIQAARGAAAPDTTVPAPPVRLPDHDLIEFLGQGSVAQVWRARARRTGPPTAIKLFAGDGTADERRFLLESEVTRNLNHPGIPRWLSQGRAEGYAFHEFELVEGLSLDAILAGVRAIGGRANAESLLEAASRAQARSIGVETRRGPLLSAYDLCAVDWVRQLAAALAHAHERGVLHRDVKPANARIEPTGRARILDFGHGRGSERHFLTMTGDVLGTPAYMAPEAWQGEARTQGDVYSLGLVLLECLTLERPRGAGSGVPGSARAVAGLRELRPDLPRAIEHIARRACAPRPEERYETARGFSDDLGRFLRGERTVARGPTRRERWRMWSAARPRKARALRAGAAVLVLALVGAGAVVLAGESAQQRAQAAQEEAARERARREVRQTLERLRDPVWTTMRLRVTHVQTLLRHPGSETTAALVDELEGMTERVWAGRMDAYRPVLDAVEGLGDALGRWRAALALEDLSAADRQALERAHGKLVAGQAGQAEQAILRSVAKRRGPTDASTLAVLCEALARLPSDPRAVAALSRHLSVEPDEAFASEVGSALADLSLGPSGREAARVVELAARRFGANSRFWERAYLAIAISDPGVGEPDPATVTAGGIAFGGRRVNGEIRDRTGTWLLVPQYLDSWLGLGAARDALSEERRREADAVLALEANPTSATAWADLGSAKARRLALGEATADFLAALDHAPGSIEILLRRADARRVRGDVDGAMKDLDRILEIEPRTAYALALRIMARNDKGDWTGAIEDAARALAAGPTDGERVSIHLYRAMAHQCLGDLESALADVVALLGLHPDNTEGLHCGSRARALRGDLDAAIQASRRAVAADAAYYLGWLGLGTWELLAADRHAAAGRSAEASALRTRARADLDRAIAEDPRLPFAWLNRAVLSLHEGDPQAAEADASAAAVRCPRLPHPHLARAQALALLGKGERAARSARTFLRLAPDDPLRSEAEAILETGTGQGAARR